jgi:hypothetical protein
MASSMSDISLTFTFTISLGTSTLYHEVEGSKRHVGRLKNTTYYWRLIEVKNKKKRVKYNTKGHN